MSSRPMAGGSSSFWAEPEATPTVRPTAGMGEVARW